MSALLPFDQGPFALDGGLATELENRGHSLQHALWSARLLYDNPAAIAAVHEAYLEAGADVITTASYQGSLPGFMKEGFTLEEAEALMIRSVTIAQETRDTFWLRQQQSQDDHVDMLSGSSHEAQQLQFDKPPERRRRRKPLIAASCGSYGAILCNGAEFTGIFGAEMTGEELVKFHEGRVRLLARAKPDLFIFETIPSLAEAVAIREALSRSSAEIPTIVSFSCNAESTVCHGEPLADCCEVFFHVDQVVGVGVNCTSPLLVEALLRRVKSRLNHRGCQKLLVCYPNSGETWSTTERRYLDDPRHLVAFHDLTRRLLDEGLVNIMGGCCRTTPQTIRDGVVAEMTPNRRKNSTN